ncbi:MAG: DNA repair protein RadC [Ruminococcaceae bacterium]|nr:DNA repair protein RadC [Oscillospiraceae bacterium]
MKKELPHEGHRQRLKNRFLASSLDSFEPHNILELLLFYSVPRQDTNELAHSLIDRFGSLKGVFDADFKELIKVKGIKENSATLIKLIPQIARTYMLNEDLSGKVLDTVDAVGEYLVNLYIGATKEIIYILLFDANFKLLNTVKLIEGNINSSIIDPRKIFEEVARVNASMFVLAHNHPNGFAVPSMEDIETTTMLSSAFDMFSVDLLEHFVVAGDKFFPIIRETRSALNANSPKLK